MKNYTPMLQQLDAVSKEINHAITSGQYTPEQIVEMRQRLKDVKGMLSNRKLRERISGMYTHHKRNNKKK